jgi:hypothetical protein
MFSNVFLVSTMFNKTIKTNGEHDQYHIANLQNNIAKARVAQHQSSIIDTETSTHSPPLSGKLTSACLIAFTNLFQLHDQK